MTSTHRSLLAVLAGLLAWPALAAFTDNGDGTLTDTITGLMWDKCSRGQTWSSNTCSASNTATTHSWSAALSQAVTANTDSHRGYSDWRVPNPTELESLVKIDSATAPPIDGTAFPNTPSGLFWTSTTQASTLPNAWYVDFSNGETNAHVKSTTTNYVRLVRSGQSFGAFDSLDTTAPVLSSVGVSSTTATATTLAGTSNETATGYWIAVAQGSTAPSASEVEAAATYSSVTIVASGNASMTTATQKSFTVSGLTNNTAYTLYLIGKDATGNRSSVSSVNVTTLAIVNGACGSAATQSSALAPTTNLCSTGNAGTVSSANGQYTWTCTGSGGGANASCSANWASNAGTGKGSVVSNVTNNWAVGSASFSTSLPATPPTGVNFPNGILSLNLTSGTAGSDATVVVYYNTPVPAGAVYWKYGKTQANPIDHWYQLPADRAVFASDRLSVTLRLTDGGIGDHDLLANSSITDPGGPGMPPGSSVTSIPTLSEWGMIILSLLLAGMTAFRFKRG